MLRDLKLKRLQVYEMFHDKPIRIFYFGIIGKYTKIIKTCIIFTCNARIGTRLRILS